MVVEEISDFYDGEFPTLPELRAEAGRWMAVFGWEPFRCDFAQHRPRLDNLCQQLWAMARGMSLDELLPVWAGEEQEEQVQFQEAVLTVYLEPLVQAVQDVEEHWFALFDDLPTHWHPVQHWQYTLAVVDMFATDLTTNLRFQVEAQIRRAERHAPETVQLELFPD
jgi:hypothetical protein